MTFSFALWTFVASTLLVPFLNYGSLKKPTIYVLFIRDPPILSFLHKVMKPNMVEACHTSRLWTRLVWHLFSRESLPGPQWEEIQCGTMCWKRGPWLSLPSHCHVWREFQYGLWYASTYFPRLISVDWVHQVAFLYGVGYIYLSPVLSRLVTGYCLMGDQLVCGFWLTCIARRVV